LGKLVGFAIAGDDRRFYPAEVRWYSGGAVDNRGKPIFQRDTLVLGSPFVSAPTHFRHAWARNPMSNLVNGRGVPLATERSDDWILEETPVKPEIPPNLSPEAARNFAANQIRRSLEMADNERRIRQAEANLSPK
jgi:sialate O-acetylesterase